MDRCLYERSTRRDGNEADPSADAACRQRRGEAEEKLEHHLDEARHEDDHLYTADPETGTADGGDVKGGDVAAIQNDDRLTAADRVDLIANQVISEPDGNETMGRR